MGEVFLGQDYRANEVRAVVKTAHAKCDFSAAADKIAGVLDIYVYYV